KFTAMGLFYFFGPRSLRMDEVIVVGLMANWFSNRAAQFTVNAAEPNPQGRVVARLDGDEPQPPSPDLAFKAPHETSGAFSHDLVAKPPARYPRASPRQNGYDRA